MKDLVPRAAVLTLIHIHFEGFLDLVDRRWAAPLDLSRAVFAPYGERHLWLVEIPPHRRAAPRRPGRLLLRVVPPGERRDEVEGLLLDAYLDLFLEGRTPDRILAVQADDGNLEAGVRPRWIEDRLAGEALEPRFRLPYLEVVLDPRIEGGWTVQGARSAPRRDLTSAPGAGNLRPFHTPFRREPPCNSVSSVCPSRERRPFSIP